MEYDGTDVTDTIKILIDETSDIWINVRLKKLFNYILNFHYILDVIVMA